MGELSNIPVLKGRRILLGVTGSIAAYKAAELASALAQAGAQVDVLLSPGGLQFVSPLTFQALTGRTAYTDADLWGSQAHILHVDLSRRADLLLIAPATATTLARLAHGLADTLIGLTALACTCPVAVAPAMDAGMYQNPATQANLEILRQRGVFLAGPAEGRMASGEIGLGRMLEPDQLVGVVRHLLGRGGSLAGRRVVVTAGGTQEPIDPVRAVVNRSSGKQGYALAQVAIDRGAEVVLISGPSNLAVPFGLTLIEVRTAAEMQQAVLAQAGESDALLMAAAVADFRPQASSPHKIKRGQGGQTLQLEPTEDILARVAEQRKKGGRPRVIVGFAAESQDLLDNARGKLERKGLSLIVANDILSTDAGFAGDDNRVTLLDAGGGVQSLPLMPKTQVAEHILDRVEALLG
jgi:phosphopantothenoylcysteine decarboxylase / phosphopantothenate---cysteine ligase